MSRSASSLPATRTNRATHSPLGSSSNMTQTDQSGSSLDEVKGSTEVNPRTREVRGRLGSSSISEASSYRSGTRISEYQSPVIPENRRLSRSTSTTSSSGTNKSMFSAMPRPPTTPKTPGSLRGSTHRRQSIIRPRTTQADRKDYMETLVQTIAGGPKGTKMAAARGGNGPEALLAKLGQVRFDQYTDGSLAMEIRK